MNKINKALKLAALTFVAAASLLMLKPVRAWASVQGMYIYNLFALQGPAYLYKSRIGGAQGLRISTGTYAGASQTGVPAVPTGATDMRLIGGVASAARDTCSANEGEIIYDPTVHSLAFCDGTVWHKLVTGSSSNDSWTTY